MNASTAAWKATHKYVRKYQASNWVERKIPDAAVVRCCRMA